MTSGVRKRGSNSSVKRPSSWQRWHARLPDACSRRHAFENARASSAPLRQPARAFGHEQQQGQQDGRRRHLGAQHPPPSGRRVPGGVAEALDPGVGEQREEDARDDAELEERAEAPAPFRRCELRDVDRADHRRGADAQAADEAGGEELDERARQRREQPRGRVEDRAEEQHLPPPEPVAEESRGHGARDAPEDRARPGESLLRGPQREVRPEVLVGAVDDRRVVPEQEAAGGRNEGDEGERAGGCHKPGR